MDAPTATSSVAASASVLLRVRISISPRCVRTAGAHLAHAFVGLRASTGRQLVLPQKESLSPSRRIVPAIGADIKANTPNMPQIGPRGRDRAQGGVDRLRSAAVSFSRTKSPSTARFSCSRIGSPLPGPGGSDHAAAASAPKSNADAYRYME